MKKKDIILLFSVLIVSLLCLISFVIISYFSKERADMVVITVDKETVKNLPLSEDTEYLIESDEGGFNLLVIENGKAYIKEASCPDKICIHMGAASEIKPISCMPNGVVVSIKEGD